MIIITIAPIVLRRIINEFNVCYDYANEGKCNNCFLQRIEGNRSADICIEYTAEILKGLI